MRENRTQVVDDNVIPLIDWAEEQAEVWDDGNSEWGGIPIEEVEDDLKFVCAAQTRIILKWH